MCDIKFKTHTAVIVVLFYRTWFREVPLFVILFYYDLKGNDFWEIVSRRDMRCIYVYYKIQSRLLIHPYISLKEHSAESKRFDHYSTRIFKTASGTLPLSISLGRQLKGKGLFRH